MDGLMRAKALFKFIFSASLVFGGATALVGCSSFYYHPSKLKFVDPTKLSPPIHSHHFKSKSGNQIHAWYRPAVEKPKALIVHFHGNAQNLTSHFFFLNGAPKRGFDHFVFDYSGYGESEGAPSPKALVDDGESALNFARTLRDPSVPIIVFGQSLGGNIALRLLADIQSKKRTGPEIKLLILDSTFTNYRSVAREITSQSWITWLFQPLAWLIVDNSQSTSRSEVEKISPVPVWVIHGTHDRVIRYHQGEKIYKWAKDPKKLTTLEGGVHTSLLTTPKGAELFYSTLEEQLGNLGTRSSFPFSK